MRFEPIIQRHSVHDSGAGSRLKELQNSLSLDFDLRKHVTYSFYFDLTDYHLVIILIHHCVTIELNKDSNCGVMTGSVADWDQLSRFLLTCDSDVSIRKIICAVILYLENLGYTFKGNKKEIGDGTFIWM